MSRIIIFANGYLPDLEKARALIRADDTLIAADGGTRHALALGLKPDLIVGDLDSITEDERQKMESDGVKIAKHSRDKNETDLELAIQYALELKPEQIIIVAALGGRLDQTLANLALISDERLTQLDVRLDDGVEEAFFCRDQVRVQGGSGDVVSLIPWQGAVAVVRTENLKWPLHNEMLYPEKSRGVSNEMTSDIASIEIKSGLLLVVHYRNS
ncbi:MAG: thiamine diphosphokinase [Anaerolineales bacterium]|nr:thiamine diphosphokinase [Anaerolineales bacterium]